MQVGFWLSAIEFEQIISSSVTENYVWDKDLRETKSLIYSEKYLNKGSGITYYFVLIYNYISYIGNNLIQYE